MKVKFKVVKERELGEKESIRLYINNVYRNNNCILSPCFFYWTETDEKLNNTEEFLLCREVYLRDDTKIDLDKNYILKKYKDKSALEICEFIIHKVFKIVELIKEVAPEKHEVCEQEVIFFTGRKK